VRVRGRCAAHRPPARGRRRRAGRAVVLLHPQPLHEDLMTAERTTAARSALSWTRGPLAAALAVVLLVSGSAAVHADDLDDKRAQAAKGRERENLEAELEHTDAQLADAVLELDRVEGRLPVAEAELAVAEADLERAEREAAILAQRLADAQVEEATVSRQL